ncbi:hypothetical protein [Methylophilus sp. 3sh_L]|uniref:hypothetical protein n=1 Tax=Methylophilus sp. 3sh_L TaxID=3377114 RepID=UPI00398E8ECC
MASKPNNKPLTSIKPATPPAKPVSTAKTPATSKPAAKPAVPATAKPAAKPVVKAATPAKKTTATPAIKVVNKVATPAKDKADKDKPKTSKVKMERDSFTMPKEEYAQIAILKKRLETLEKPVKKSELLRAGLKLLSAMDDAALKAALASIPVIKTGRPKK